MTVVCRCLAVSMSSWTKPDKLPGFLCDMLHLVNKLSFLFLSLFFSCFFSKSRFISLFLPLLGMCTYECIVPTVCKYACTCRTTDCLSVLCTVHTLNVPTVCAVVHTVDWLAVLTLFWITNCLLCCCWLLFPRSGYTAKQNLFVVLHFSPTRYCFHSLTLSTYLITAQPTQLQSHYVTYLSKAITISGVAHDFLPKTIILNYMTPRLLRPHFWCLFSFLPSLPPRLTTLHSQHGQLTPHAVRYCTALYCTYHTR